MSLFALLKFLHVLGAASVASIQVGSDFYFDRVARSGDTAGAAGLGAAIRRRGRIEGPILEITVALGLITALVGGFDLLSRWLLLAYADVIVMAALAFRVGAPAFTALIEAAKAGDSREVERLVRDRRRRFAVLSNAALYALLVFLMVVKPLA